MRSFTHFDANSIEEACAILDEYKGKACLNAGGSDLLQSLREICCPIILMQSLILRPYPVLIISRKKMVFQAGRPRPP